MLRGREAGPAESSGGGALERDVVGGEPRVGGDDAAGAEPAVPTVPEARAAARDHLVCRRSRGVAGREPGRAGDPVGDGGVADAVGGGELSRGASGGGRAAGGAAAAASSERVLAVAGRSSTVRTSRGGDDDDKSAGDERGVAQIVARGSGGVVRGARWSALASGRGGRGGGRVARSERSAHRWTMLVGARGPAQHERSRVSWEGLSVRVGRDRFDVPGGYAKLARGSPTST